MFHSSASEVSSHDSRDLWSCNECGNHPGVIIHIETINLFSYDFCDDECIRNYLNNAKNIPAEIREKMEEYLNETT